MKEPAKIMIAGDQILFVDGGSSHDFPVGWSMYFQLPIAD